MRCSTELVALAQAAGFDGMGVDLRHLGDVATAEAARILDGSGLAASSLGLVSTGIESTGDVVAAVVTFFAVRLAARPADDSHPFGHRRAENLSALAEASSMFGGTQGGAGFGSTVAVANPGGYIDGAAPVTQMRLRYDSMYGNNRPDRAEFFYPKCGCFGGIFRPISRKTRGPISIGPQ